jgi:two-component system NtrC family response regulator/two-component system response regulator HydG/two-component system response regulator AtoC
MTDTLLESQLFGHERGAFTGAEKTVKGKFELADKGTLFLDELADMSLLAQAKILRAIEYGEFERLGSERMLQSNARVISATNCSLREKIRDGKFREDLFHRLNGLTLVIPALRDRVDELPALVAAELKSSALSAGKKITAIHPEAMDKLLAHDWRGNLRELKHLVRTMILFCEASVIQPEHVIFPPDLDSIQPPTIDPSETQMCVGNLSNSLTLSDAVERHVRFVYEQNNRNQRQTAKHLGISRATLVRHLRRLQE